MGNDQSSNSQRENDGNDRRSRSSSSRTNPRSGLIASSNISPLGSTEDWPQSSEYRQPQTLRQEVLAGNGFRTLSHAGEKRNTSITNTVGSTRDPTNPYMTSEDSSKGAYPTDRENLGIFLNAALPNLKDWVVNNPNAMYRLLQHPMLVLDANDNSEVQLHLRQQRLMRFLAEFQSRVIGNNEIEVQVMRELDRRYQLSNLQIAAVRQNLDSYMQGSDQIGVHSVHQVGWDLFLDLPPQVGGIPDEMGTLPVPNGPGPPPPVTAFPDPEDLPQPQPNEPPQPPSYL